MKHIGGLRALAGATAIALLSAASASALTFTGNFSLSGSAYSDPGLVIQTNPTSGSGSFDLNVGESLTFDLFNIWTAENSVQSDDVQPQSLDATFTLTSPAFATGIIGGTTNGHVWPCLCAPLKAWGSVSWDGPLDLMFGNGGILRLALSDEIFNKGIFGLGTRGATVQLTATYVQEPAPVPLPAAGLLLMGGLGAIAALRRRRTAA